LLLPIKCAISFFDKSDIVGDGVPDFLRVFYRRCIIPSVADRFGIGRKHAVPVCQRIDFALRMGFPVGGPHAMKVDDRR